MTTDDYMIVILVIIGTVVLANLILYLTAIKTYTLTMKALMTRYDEILNLYKVIYSMYFNVTMVYLKEAARYGIIPSMPQLAAPKLPPPPVQLSIGMPSISIAMPPWPPAPTTTG